MDEPYTEFVIDWETGGLDLNSAALLAVSLLRLKEGYQPAEAGLRFYIQPQAGRTIEPEAAEVCGYTPERWAEFKALPLDIVMRFIQEKFNGLHVGPLAHNAIFDQEVTRVGQQLSGVDLGLKLWRCSMQVFRFWRDVTGIWGSVTLDSLCEICGYSRNPENHESLDDCRAVAEGYRWMLEDIRNRRKLPEVVDARAFTMPFGKYKGTTLGEMCDRTPQYLDWLFQQSWLVGDLQLALVRLYTSRDFGPKGPKFSGT